MFNHNNMVECELIQQMCMSLTVTELHCSLRCFAVHMLYGMTICTRYI